MVILKPISTAQTISVLTRDNDATSVYVELLDKERNVTFTYILSAANVDGRLTFDINHPFATDRYYAINIYEGGVLPSGGDYSFNDYSISDYNLGSLAVNLLYTTDYSALDYSLVDYNAGGEPTIGEQIFRGKIYITDQDDLGKYNPVTRYYERESTNTYKYND